MVPLLVGVVMISSGVSAESSTGGNSVGSGGTIIEGNSSASAQVVNRVGPGGSGTSSVTIETNVNGVRNVERVERAISREGIVLDVATSASSKGAGAGSELQKSIRSLVETKIRATTSTSSRPNIASTTPLLPRFGQLIIRDVFAILQNIFGRWFW